MFRLPTIDIKLYAGPNFLVHRTGGLSDLIASACGVPNSSCDMSPDVHEQNASVPLRLTKELLTERGSTSLASGIRNGRRANICIRISRACK